MNPRDLHREAIGLAVGPADLNLLPLTVRWGSAPEPTARQARPVRPRGWRLRKRPVRPPVLPWQTAHALVWRHRTA